jgi:hypothetical protein
MIYILGFVWRFGWNEFDFSLDEMKCDFINLVGTNYFCQFYD